MGSNVVSNVFVWELHNAQYARLNSMDERPRTARHKGAAVDARGTSAPQRGSR